MMNCLDSHYPRIPPKALQNASPTNGGGGSVKRASQKILMALRSVCIHFHNNKWTCFQRVTISVSKIVSISNSSEQGECLLNFDCIFVIQCNWKDWHIIILNSPIFTKKYILETSKWRFYIEKSKKKSVQMFKSDFYHKFCEKIKDFHCYLLLAAENLLLAEQLQISASSSASKLPARANTNLMSSIQIRIWLCLFKLKRKKGNSTNFLALALVMQLVASHTRER